MKQFDCVVIGSGNGGLGACCKMLKEGKTCLMVEKHNLPGGFATSFVRGRFEFEASLHEFNGVGTGDNMGHTGEIYKELGVYDKIEWLEIENAFHLYSKEEGIDFIMPVGIEKCIEACKPLCEDGDKLIGVRYKPVIPRFWRYFVKFAWYFKVRILSVSASKTLPWNFALILSEP